MSKELFTTNDGIRRSKERITKNGEVFTPFAVIDQMITKIPEEKWKDPKATFLDPNAGSGNILVRMLEKRLASGISVEDAVKTLYGVELMQDNRDLCVQRILEIVGPKYSKIVNKNIVCADFFKWDFENWKPKEEVDETKIENSGFAEFVC